jgi:hypothetical protein
MLRAPLGKRRDLIQVLSNTWGHEMARKRAETQAQCAIGTVEVETGHGHSAAIFVVKLTLSRF